MIKFLQFKKKYESQIYSFVYSTMLKELKIDEETLKSITCDVMNINENYLKNGGNFWIAVDSENNNVIGTVGIKRINKRDAEFKRFYVKKEYRNKKIGYKLYLIAEIFSKINQIENLYLASGIELTKAHKIYYKNGWKKIDKNIENIGIFIRKEAELYKKEIKQDNYFNINTEKCVYTNFLIKGITCIHSLAG